MLVTFLILICVVSLILHGTMDITVHNQYSDIELALPVYFYDGGTCCEHPVERMDAEVMIKVGFTFGLDKLSGGILMYKAQRNTQSDHQSSTDTISTEVVEDTSKVMQLLVVWKIDSFREPKVNVVLVEHENELVLNEDKLAQLYSKVNNMPLSYNREEIIFDYDSDDPSFDSSRRTWLMCDNTVLATTHKVVHEGGHELRIAISQGIKGEDTMRPIWIDSERQVSSLMVIYSMLICIASLTFQSTINMTISNQCSNIELTSPVYFIKDVTWHGHFPQQVDFKSRMKVDFRTGMDRDTFGGVLLYHLQRKENDESDNRPNTDKDISSSTHLLVIWGRDSEDKPYSCGYLVEHESALFWNEDKLERLHHVYDSQYEAYSSIGQEEWLLDDDTMLKTKFESSHGGFEMEVIISEEEYLYTPRKPLFIDPSK
jgi:hypothetical protein